MSEFSVAAAELRKISRAFAGLAVLESSIDAAVRAESALAASKAEIAKLDASIVEKRKAADSEEIAIAKRHAHLMETSAKAQDEADRNATLALATDTKKYAKMVALSEGKLKDVAARVEIALLDLAQTDKRLAGFESDIVIAKNKLSDINAAIAAIVNR